MPLIMCPSDELEIFFLPPTSKSPLSGPEGPRHGDRGSGSFPAICRNFGVVAVSREPGSRGGRLGHAMARKLGYTLFDREALEFLAGQPDRMSQVVDCLPLTGQIWVEERLRLLTRQIKHFDEVRSTARLVNALAAQGGVVIVGRGAGFLLPSECLLHLRVVGERGDRQRYLAQWLRLPAEQAEVALAEADRRRQDFLHRHFGPAFASPISYDAIVNTSRLGEEGALLVAQQAMLARFPGQTTVPV